MLPGNAARHERSQAAQQGNAMAGCARALGQYGIPPSEPQGRACDGSVTLEQVSGRAARGMLG
jgi:hypothetical protein